MKRTKFILTCSAVFIFGACLYCPIFHAMPKFMERFDADPYAKAELKGRCTVCHKNDDGFGMLNKIGQAFAKSGYRISDELRKEAPEAFAATPDAARKVEPAFNAKAFYAKSCAVCHGVDGKGGDGGMIVPNFTDVAWQRRHSEEKLISAINNGKGTMPAFKEKLTEDQIKAMAAFIRTFPEQK